MSIREQSSLDSVFGGAINTFVTCSNSSVRNDWTMTETYDVFLSHSHVDRVQVEFVAGQFTAPVDPPRDQQ